MQSKMTALVLGASGGIGGEVARQLRDAGWNVRGLARNPQTVKCNDGITWFIGDAMCGADVMMAAQGCAVIVHAVNPPGYHRWEELVLPMLENTILAAKAQGATIVLPGTVYNFGLDAFPEPHEKSPQHPHTSKGAVRVELERRLRLATDDGARVILVRAGDYFGPKPGNSWFSQGMVRPGRSVATVSLLGKKGIGHQWSYLPDVARTMVELIARRGSLDAFADFHMAGHWDADGTQMAQAIRRVVVGRGGSTPKFRAFPWWLVKLTSPFISTFRELQELRYLWKTPMRMNNDKLLAMLGEEPHTPLDQAVEATLEGMGCLVTTNRAAVSMRLANTLALVTAIVTGGTLLSDHVQAAPVTHIDNKAPVISRNEIFISAPLETVWALQTDVSLWPQWRPTVSSAHLDGDLKVGSAFKWEEGGLQIVSTVQAMTPMRRIVWTGPAQGINAVHVWEFIATDSGVLVRTEESWSGEIVSAQSEKLQPLLDHALQDWLTRLKATSEGRLKRMH